MPSNLGPRRGGQGVPLGTPLRLVRAGPVRRGLSREVVEEISWQHNEPDWMRRKRIQAYEVFERLPMPSWGPDLSHLDFHGIAYAEPQTQVATPTWDTDRSRLRRELDAKGVVFVEMSTAVARFPDLVKEHFMTRNVPAYDSRFAALNGAIWRGGWFIYVPEGKTVDLPLEPPAGGPADDFGHTLIIAEPDSAVRFISASLHAAPNPSPLRATVVEVFLNDRARVRYVAVENEGKETHNFATRRALVTGAEAQMEWIDASLGNATAMLYPGSHLLGRASRAEHVSLWLSRDGQRKDVGARVIHVGADTSSRVLAKSVAVDGGQAAFRAIVRVSPSAIGASADIRSDALVLDERSRASSCPDVQLHQSDATVVQGTSVCGLSAGRLGQLMADGLTAGEARARVLGGFVAPVVRELPTETAVAVDKMIRA